MMNRSCFDNPLETPFARYRTFMSQHQNDDQMTELCLLIQTSLRNQSIRLLGLENEFDHLLWHFRKRELELEVEKMNQEDEMIRRQVVSVVEERLKLLASETDPSWKLREHASMTNIAHAYKLHPEDSDAATDQWKMTDQQATALETALSVLFPDDFTDGKDVAEFLDKLASEASITRDVGYKTAHPGDISIEIIQAKFARTNLEKWSKALSIASRLAQFRSFGVLEFATALWSTGTRANRRKYRSKKAGT